MPTYANPNINGILSAFSNSDGYAIRVRWATAYPVLNTNSIAYNIYYSTKDDYTYPENLFDNGPQLLSLTGLNFADILDLTPGQTYFFGVRAVEYDTNVDPTELSTIFGNLKAYPQGLLRSDISASELTIPMADVEGFPSKGYIKVGVEIIQYTSVDTVLNNINASQRGALSTSARSHTAEGSDGYNNWSSTVLYYLGTEDQNTKNFQCQNRFDYPEWSYTNTDGYRQRVKDLLTTDLSGSDAANQNFPTYDYSSYHMTDPVALLSGDCVGSYIGGEMGCVDGYTGVGRVLRGMSFQDQNNQREETLLELTGEPVVLFKKRRTGVMCNCYIPSSEYPDDRCPKCFGQGFVVGYEQFFNPRRSDGRILVRFSPVDEVLKPNETGLESEVIADCWSLTVPTIKDRDFIIRFDEEDNEEFRYEVLSVNRNKLLFGTVGGQRFKAQRVRKTDPIYQVPAIRNTSFFPGLIYTSVDSSIGFPPHSHSVVISEKILDISQINQISGVSLGHSHVIKQGIVLNHAYVGSSTTHAHGDSGLGHNHVIILP